MLTAEEQIQAARETLPPGTRFYHFQMPTAMKVVFTYTDSPDVRSLRKDEIFNSILELPNAALGLPDCSEHALAAARVLAHFTNSCLHITCKELSFINYPIKTEATPITGGDSLHVGFQSLVLVFDSYRSHKQQHRMLRVLRPDFAKELVPHSYPLRSHKHMRSLLRNLVSPHYMANSVLTESQQTNQILLSQAVEHILALLNSDPSMSWTYSGFSPRWLESRLINRHNKTSKRREAETRRKERDETRRAKIKERADAAQVAQSEPADTYVYFIQAGEDGLIKIGFSAKPQKRLATLTTASAVSLHLLKVVKGDKQLETTLHDRFSPTRKRGEWFEPTPELLAFIENLRMADTE